MVLYSFYSETVTAKVIAVPGASQVRIYQLFDHHHLPRTGDSQALQPLQHYFQCSLLLELSCQCIFNIYKQSQAMFPKQFSRPPALQPETSRLALSRSRPESPPNFEHVRLPPLSNIQSSLCLQPGYTANRCNDHKCRRDIGAAIHMDTINELPPHPPPLLPPSEQSVPQKPLPTPPAAGSPLNSTPCLTMPPISDPPPQYQPQNIQNSSDESRKDICHSNIPFESFQRSVKANVDEVDLENSLRQASLTKI